MTDHDQETRHAYSPSPLFERRGDRFVSRGIGGDRPYERIFRLRIWLALSLLLNFCLLVYVLTGGK